MTACFAEEKGKASSSMVRRDLGGGETPICPKQGPKMKGIVLHRVGILGFVFHFPGKDQIPHPQGQGFKPSAAPIVDNWKCM